MNSAPNPFPAKRQILSLLVYFVPLALLYEAEKLLARNELAMQTLDTLWPVVAFTLLLLTTLGCALLLARRIPLWLLLALHAACAVLWLASLQADIHSRSTEQGHICSSLFWPPWLLLPLLAACALPPLLGLGLLKLRKRQLQTTQGMEHG